MTEAASVFDHEDIYDAEIFPLMKRILEVCKEHGIPMAATFCYGRDADGGEHCCTSAIPWTKTTDILAQLAKRGIRDGESVRIGSGALAMTVTTPSAPDDINPPAAEDDGGILALENLEAQVQGMREDGEGDLRTVLYFIREAMDSRRAEAS